MSATIKLERFNARLRVEQKRMLERAAELTGRKLTEFVVGSACAAARETIERYEGMVLTDPRDRDSFVAAMLATSAPSEKLRAAAARYREATKEHA